MKNTTKTILEWLEQAKADGYEWADAAIENTINDPSPAGHCFEESLYEALCGAFIFDETPQGEEYWQSISISLLNSGKMKNTVSFPTAQRLKAVGFPQPEPESGQVWYEGQKAYVLGKIKQRQLHGVYLDGECFEACDINAMQKISSGISSKCFFNICSYRCTRSH